MIHLNTHQLVWIIMPEWRDKGIVLSVRKYGEKGIIANLLTLEHGRHLGWVTNYNKKNIASHVQPGNLVDIFWKSRLIEQMGNFKIELISRQRHLPTQRYFTKCLIPTSFACWVLFLCRRA